MKRDKMIKVYVNEDTKNFLEFHSNRLGMSMSDIYNVSLNMSAEWLAKIGIKEMEDVGKIK